MEKQINLTVNSTNTQVVTGDNVHVIQNNLTIFERVESLLGPLTALDLDEPSAEVQRLREFIKSENASGETAKEVVQAVADKGPKYQEALKAFAEGATKVLAEKAGEAITHGAIALPVLVEAIKILLHK